MKTALGLHAADLFIRVIRAIRGLIYALSHLGLLRLLPHRLPRLPAGPPEQPADEHLVDAGLIHFLRLVESVVFAAAVRHLGHRLLDGRLDGAQAEHAKTLAHYQ